MAVLALVIVLLLGVLLVNQLTSMRQRAAFDDLTQQYSTLSGAYDELEESCAALEQTARDNNEALFSSHPITRDQRQTAADLRTAVLEYFKQQKKWYKRLILKWLKCLY